MNPTLVLCLIVGLVLLGIAGWLGRRAAKRQAAARQLAQEAAAVQERLAVERREAMEAATREGNARRVVEQQAARAEARRREAAEADRVREIAAEKERIAADLPRQQRARDEAARIARVEAHRAEQALAAAARRVERPVEQEQIEKLHIDFSTTASPPVIAPAPADPTASTPEAAAAPMAEPAPVPAAMPIAMPIAIPTAIPPAIPIVERAGPPPAARIAPPASTSHVFLQPPLILIADDSKIVRVKTGRLLAKHDFRVGFAADGHEAWEQIQSTSPAIVITDVDMPGLDGFQLTRQLRANAATSHIPVIMITAADDKVADQAREAGVDLLLGKPYEEAELIAHIQRSLAAAFTPTFAPAATPSVHADVQ